MNELNKTIETYLKHETNHAVLITGDWGIGKTFYFENTLRPQINNTLIHSKGDKKYKTIRISLFGVKSIEDINKRILLESYPILKKKATNIVVGLGKVVLSGVLPIVTKTDLSNIFDDSGLKYEDFNKLSDLVICFDDFERKSEELKIIDLVGYINSLVENGNTKTIILIAENKLINEEEIKAYRLFKEKIIGVTINFNQDLSSQFKNIVSFKKINSSYHKILLNKENYITKIFQSNSKNLRTLIFVLTYFEQVFTEFNDNISHHPLLEKIKEEIIERLLKFSLIIGIEYKKGELNYLERKEIDTNLLDWKNLFSTSPIALLENKETYREHFIKTYYTDERYYFFDSIYDFFTGGRQFEQKKMFNELNNLYGISNNKEIESESLYQDIMMPKLFNLSNAEYRQKIKKVLSYVDKGKYTLDKYLIIFIQVATLGKDLKYNLNRLENRFIKGMQLGGDNYVYDEHLFMFSHEIPDASIVPYVEKIKQVAVLLNIEAQKSLHRKELKNLEYNFYKNYSAFKENFSNKQFIYEHGAVFSKFNTKKFIKHLSKMKNPELWEFYTLINKRYSWYINNVKEDIPFLKHLYQHIVQRTQKFISGHILKLMAFRLLEIIQKLENAEDIENSGKTINVNPH